MGGVIQLSSSNLSPTLPSFPHASSVESPLVFLTSMSQFNDLSHVSVSATLDDPLPVENRAFSRAPGIQRIDFGILLEIFKLATCVPDDTKLEDVLDTLPRGYLGRVCREWHNFMVKQPSLWTTIVLPSSIGLLTTSEDHPLMMFLRRSRKRPLSIYVIPGRPSQRGVGGYTRDGEWAVADAVSKVGARVRSLVFQARWRSSIDRLGNTFDPQLYPILNQLTIDASIEDTGRSDVPYLAAIGRSTLTTLSIDAKYLLTLTSSSRTLFHTIGNITSLTIIDVLPNTAGFPEDGMARLMDFTNSLPRLLSLTFDRFAILEGSLTSERWRHLATAPYPICALTVKNSNATAIGYLIHRLAPRELMLDECKLTTSSILRLPPSIDALSLSRIRGEDVELSVLPMLSSFVGTHLTVRDCPFVTHHFLHLVLGRARLNLRGIGSPSLHYIQIKDCSGADGTREFHWMSGSRKATM
ncbi:hypothetical protein DFP72DRAFT_1177849 [Ephemerocybe angulata]|uniref:F-box domain-containing protein n=1 Tax=Ephemerocybe angulata TaxID=980116 RepID=A0A8H6HCE6_9AGAR|nr:hypothetical protein DFP72DRAFT_1177849 [Tulosesus angulatus]